MQLATVHWVDAWGDMEDSTVKASLKLKPIERVTCGFLIKNDEDAVILCTDYFPGSKKDEVNTRSVIPAQWVTKVYLWTES